MIVQRFKDFAKSTKVKLITSTSTILATIAPGYCDIDGNSTMQTFLKTMFSLLTFGGIIFIVAGAVSLLRTVISLSSGEQSQPGALGKGIGLLIAGIILVAAKALITSITGQDPTTMKFM